MSEPINPVTIEKIVLVLRDDLPLGTAVNVASCLTAGIIAKQPHLAGHPLVDAAQLVSVATSHVPIVALKGNTEVLQRLLDTLHSQQQTQPLAEGSVSLFPDYARSIHSPELYWQQHQTQSHSGQQLLGLALCGATKWLNKLTGNLPLLR